MAYSKTLLTKAVKRRDPRMARKGASDKTVKCSSPGADFSQAVKFLRDN